MERLLSPREIRQLVFDTVTRGDHVGQYVREMIVAMDYDMIKRSIQRHYKQHWPIAPGPGISVRIAGKMVRIYPHDDRVRVWVTW